MHIEELAEAIGRAQGAALDAVTRALWAGVVAGEIGEADASRLSAAITERRPVGRAPGGPRQIGAVRLRPIPQRCPDRIEALERARRWAAGGRMPPAIAAKFTTGEQAALAVIALQVSKRQFCDMAIGAIAALAGISEATVKRAVRGAKKLGLLTVEERRLSYDRNDTNIVRIVAEAWLSWIALRERGGGGQRRTGTNTVEMKKGKNEGAEPSQVPSQEPLGELSKELPKNRDRTRGDPPPNRRRKASRMRARR